MRSDEFTMRSVEYRGELRVREDRLSARGRGEPVDDTVRPLCRVRDSRHQCGWRGRVTITNPWIAGRLKAAVAANNPKPMPKPIPI
jgi:hypothetical protein